MAWQVASVGHPPVKIVSHGRSLEGFMAAVAFRPDVKIVVAFMVNASSAISVGMIQLVSEVPDRFLRWLPPSKLTDQHPMYYLAFAALRLTDLSAVAEVASVAAMASVLACEELTVRRRIGVPCVSGLVSSHSSGEPLAASSCADD